MSQKHKQKQPRKRKLKTPPGALTWAFLFYAILGIAGVVRMLRVGATSIEAVSVVCLAVAFGLWHRKVWARWTGAVLSSLFVLVHVAGLAQGGKIGLATLGEMLVHAWLAAVLIWKWSKR